MWGAALAAIAAGQIAASQNAQRTAAAAQGMGALGSSMAQLWSREIIVSFEHNALLSRLTSKAKSILNSLREVLQFETDEWLDDLSFSTDVRQEFQKDTDEWLDDVFN